MLHGKKTTEKMRKKTSDKQKERRGKGGNHNGYRRENK